MKKEPEKPLLSEILPGLADELRLLFTRCGLDELARQVARVRVYDKCRCGDSFCSSIYATPKPEGAWGLRHETVALDTEKGMINVDVLDGQIVYIEVIDRPDIKEAVERNIG